MEGMMEANLYGYIYDVTGNEDEILLSGCRCDGTFGPALRDVRVWLIDTIPGNLEFCKF